MLRREDVEELARAILDRDGLDAVRIGDGFAAADIVDEVVAGLPSFMKEKFVQVVALQ